MEIRSLKEYPDSVLLIAQWYYAEWQAIYEASGMSLEDVKKTIETPAVAILGVAGRFDWDQLCETVQRGFGEWRGAAPRPPQVAPAAGGAVHLTKPSAQVHIAMAHPAVPMAHPQYYAARLAEAVLSGGMSSRLFTEVREKRGLVYHVSCRYHHLKAHAGMFTYAAAIPAKAQATLEVTAGEIRRLAEGIEEEEMARARIQLKSALVMMGESTAARAGAMASDWYHLGRLRSLHEISAAIDGVSREAVLAYAGVPPQAIHRAGHRP